MPTRSSRSPNARGPMMSGACPEASATPRPQPTARSRRDIPVAWVVAGTDCAARRNLCQLWIAPQDTLDHLVVVGLGFDPSSPPHVPDVSVEPSTALRHEQRVTVRGADFAAAADVTIEQCVEQPALPDELPVSDVDACGERRLLPSPSGRASSSRGRRLRDRPVLAPSECVSARPGRRPPCVRPISTAAACAVGRRGTLHRSARSTGRRRAAARRRTGQLRRACNSAGSADSSVGRRYRRPSAARP